MTEREPVDMTKPGDRDEVYRGMRASETRVDAGKALRVAAASGAAGWAPARAARYIWWLEGLTREQAEAMIAAYYDEPAEDVIE